MEMLQMPLFNDSGPATSIAGNQTLKWQTTYGGGFIGVSSGSPNVINLPESAQENLELVCVGNGYFFTGGLTSVAVYTTYIQNNNSSPVVHNINLWIPD